MLSGALVSLLFVILLSLIPSATAFNTQQRYEPPPNCDKVCAFSNILHPTDYYNPGSRLDAGVGNSGKCVVDEYTPWRKSARRFMTYLGMHDATFECPRVNIDEQPTPITNFFRAPSLSPMMKDVFANKNDYTRASNDLNIVEPGNVPGHCFFTANRGVMYRDSNGNYVTDWISSELLSRNESQFTPGFIFVLLNERTKRVCAVGVPRNSNDSCTGTNCGTAKILWLPLTTFNTSVTDTHTDNRFAVYSMFAKLDHEDVPGMSRTLSNMAAGVKQKENVDSDLTTSNLAILCLPLVMSIPPISMLDSVSDSVTVWYAFATDFLAALPLLIKGIELTIAYQKAGPEIYSTISMTGKQYGIFERWYVRYHPPPGKFGWVGNVLVIVPLWFIVASTFVEFMFWKKGRYDQGRPKRMNDEVNWIVAENLPAPEIESDLDDQQSKHFCAARMLNYVLSIIFFIVTTSYIVVEVMPNAHPSNYGMWAFDGVISTLFVFVRALAMNRTFQFVRLRFLVGIVFGCIGGPMYLFLHAFKGVRHSENWKEVSDGANFGFASVVMILNNVCYSILVGEPNRNGYITGSLLFIFVFGVTSAILHVIRSWRKEKTLWWYALYGFLLGVLFGPFGIAFKHCFPELWDEKKEMRPYFFQALFFGAVFMCLLIANAIRIAIPKIGAQPSRIPIYNPSATLFV